MLRYTRRAIGVAVSVMKLRASGFHVSARVSTEPDFSNRGNPENDLGERREKNGGSP